MNELLKRRLYQVLETQTLLIRLIPLIVFQMRLLKIPIEKLLRIWNDGYSL